LGLEKRSSSYMGIRIGRGHNWRWHGVKSVGRWQSVAIIEDAAEGSVRKDRRGREGKLKPPVPLMLCD
jgi:hypothetical protein